MKYYYEIILSVVIFIVVVAMLLYSTLINIISFDLATFLIFIAFLGILVFIDRKKVKLEGIIIIRRTNKGKKFLDNVAKHRPWFWSKMAVIGIVIGVIGLIVGTAFLTTQAYDIVVGGKEGGVKLLLPGPVSTPVNAPGVFVVPWWIWVIGIAAVIIPHEGFHGIMCRLDKIRIKSVGWLLLFIIPGAFVEPDEKQLKKAKRKTKLKVYAAGSFANILFAFVVLLLLALPFPLLFSNTGVFITGNNTGFTVYEINGTRIYDRAGFLAELSKYDINYTVQMKIAPVSTGYPIPKFTAESPIIPERVLAVSSEERALYNVTLTREPEKIETIQAVDFSGGNLISYYYGWVIILLWVFIFSLGVGIVNLLPIKPLDGGLIFEELAGKFTKSAKLITKIVSIIVLLILIFNLVGPVFV